MEPLEPQLPQPVPSRIRRPDEGEPPQPPSMPEPYPPPDEGDLPGPVSCPEPGSEQQISAICG